MDAAVQHWLQSQLGTSTDLADLTARYERLASARAVALEVLRERLAELLTQPATVTVSGVVGIGTAENIKAYERKIAALEAGEPPAPDDPDDGTTPGAIGVLYLRERARR